MRAGWKLPALLIFLGLVLFVPTAYSQLNNLDILESPSKPGNGGDSSVSAPASTPLEGAAGSAAAPPAAEIEVPAEALFLSETGTGRFEVTFLFPEDFHQTKQEEFFSVSAPDSSPLKVTEVEYPAGVQEDGLINYYGSATLTVQVSARENINAGEYRIPFTASYQLCDEAGTCFFPEDETVMLTVNVPQDVAAGTIGPNAAGAAAGIETASAAGVSAAGNAPFSLTTLLKYLLFALVGGLLLNVMPCVLPVLSIRALNLVKQSSNSRAEIFKGSLFYTVGVLLSLLLLASVVIALKLSGELVGWGFQFQNPAFVVFLIVVVFVFALSLFDVFIFQAPTMNGAVQRASRKGYVGSFFNGIIAVLLATPCTAPLLGTALGFAFSQPPYVIVSVFTMVGIGFALPFLLIGIKPALIHKLPKPGPWMNTFKELMGFVLLATVIYLLSILRFQIDSAQIIRVLLFLLILGFLLWVYGKTASPVASRKRKWIILAIFIILSVSAAGRLLEFQDSPDQRRQTTASLWEGWERFSPDKLKEYRESNEPVLVIFSAKWCTVCKLNEQTVLHTEQADQLFRSQNVKVLYGDYTNKDPVIEEWIRYYGRAGVPVYAYYPAGEEYSLLPEVLTFQILRNKIDPSS